MLSHITATLRGGQLTALLGTNGSGKTTLMRTMAGMLTPLGGGLTIGGEDVRRLTPSRMGRLVSVVLTERVAAEGLTLRGLVGLGRSPYTNFWGSLTPNDNKAVDEAMATTGILHLAQREASTLSDGEMQKAMIAKALAQETPVMMLDEPTAFLDFPGKLSVMRLLRRLAVSEGKAILLTTHDLHLALEATDSLWLITPDEGLLAGSTGELRPRISETFGLDV